MIGPGTREQKKKQPLYIPLNQQEPLKRLAIHYTSNPKRSKRQRWRVKITTFTSSICYVFITITLLFKKAKYFDLRKSCQWVIPGPG